MKVTIKGDVYDTSLDWVFTEQREVERLVGITRGQFWGKFVEGSGLPVAALAVVGFMRAKPNEPRDFIMGLVPGDPQNGVTADLSEEDEDQPDPTPAPKKRRSAKS